GEAERSPVKVDRRSLTNCSNRVSFQTPIQKVSFVPPLGFLAGCGEKRIRLRGCCNSERLESALRRGDSARILLPNNPGVKLIVAGVSYHIRNVPGLST